MSEFCKPLLDIVCHQGACAALAFIMALLRARYHRKEIYRSLLDALMCSVLGGLAHELLLFLGLRIIPLLPAWLLATLALIVLVAGLRKKSISYKGFLMHISEKGLVLLKRYEGLRLKAYQCRAGRWTIGYGHTHNLNMGDVITQEQAEAFLREDIAQVTALLNAQIKVPLTQNQ